MKIEIIVLAIKSKKGYSFLWPGVLSLSITPTDKYPSFGKPAQAGDQQEQGMPDQARHDGIG